MNKIIFVLFVILIGGCSYISEEDCKEAARVDYDMEDVGCGVDVGLIRTFDCCCQSKVCREKSCVYEPSLAQCFDLKEE